MTSLPLCKENVKSCVPACRGVYQIRIYYSNSPEPVTIPRLLAADRFGILSIGETNNLRKRLTNFINGLKNGGYHSEADRMYNWDIEKKLKRKSYQLKFCFRRVYDHELEESRLLMGYMTRFGELPPLNNREPNTDHYNSRLRERRYPTEFEWDSIHQSGI